MYDSQFRIMLMIIFSLVILLFSGNVIARTNFVTSYYTDSDFEKPPLNPARIVGELCVGGAAAYAANQYVKNKFENTGIVGEIFGGFFQIIGVWGGSALGTYVVGNIGDETGSLTDAIGGGLILGTAAAFIVKDKFNGDIQKRMDLFVLASTIGATMAFNAGRRYQDADDSNSIILYDKQNWKFSMPKINLIGFDSQTKSLKINKTNLIKIKF